MNKKILLILGLLLPMVSWGQSRISLSTETGVGEKMYFYLNSLTDIKAEGVSGDIVNKDWSEVVVQSATIQLTGEITIANFTRCQLTRVDLSACPHIKEISVSYNRIEQMTLGSQPDLTSIKVAGNRLPEEQMALLVRSLPDRTATTPGILYAKDCEDADDLNTLTPDMLRVAKARNWQIKICVFSKEKKLDEWIDYDGSKILSLESLQEIPEWIALCEDGRVRVMGADTPLQICLYSPNGELLREQHSGFDCSIEGLPKGCLLVRLSNAERVILQKIINL